MSPLAGCLRLARLLAAGCGGSKGVEGTPFQHTDSGIPDIARARPAPATRRSDAGARWRGRRRRRRRQDRRTSPGVTVAVSVDSPADDDIVPTAQRFVPQVTVAVTVPAGTVSDNLDTGGRRALVDRRPGEEDLVDAADADQQRRRDRHGTASRLRRDARRPQRSRQRRLRAAPGRDHGQRRHRDGGARLSRRLGADDHDRQAGAGQCLQGLDRGAGDDLATRSSRRSPA